MRYFVLALLLLSLAIGLVVFNRDETVYIPIARWRNTEGVFATAVQKATTSRRSCRESVEQLARTLSAQCPDCAIETQCITDPAGIELALAKGREIPVYTVVSKSVRLALVGPAQ